MTWKVESFVSDTGNLVQHIVPVDDIYEHVLLPSCWCDPTIDEEDFIATHNSADRREQFETNQRKKT